MRVNAQMTDRMEKAFEYWRNNPVEAVKDWFGVTPEDYQADVLNSLFVGGKDRVAAKSGHGVGKTTQLAWAGWIFLNLWEQCRVVSTAPTFAQLHDVLWPEYAKWHVHMPEGLAAQWDISGGHIRNKKYPKTWFAVARTSNKSANLQGFHGTDIMVQGDEASAIPPDVFEVIEGIMSEAGTVGKTSKLLLMGNPNFTAGEFYNAFHKNAPLYELYTISGDPNIKAIAGETKQNHGKIFYSKRVSEKYRSTMEKKYGIDSAVYDVRVRGLFPRLDDAACIPLQWAEQATGVTLPDFDLVADPVTVVMDVARQGGDETVLALFRRGHCISMKVWAKTSTVQCEDIVIEACRTIRAQGLTVARVIVDEPGVGGGVVDGLRRRDVVVTPYNGGETMKPNKDPEDDCRMFANRRSRDWWYARRAFEVGAIHIPDDELLINQLASVQYGYNEKERILVESKNKMRDRLGDDASPDRADVIVMGTAPWYSFRSNNVMLSEDDLIEGTDRPIAEMDLW
jgi:hypothetical protein